MTDDTTSRFSNLEIDPPTPKPEPISDAALAQRMLDSSNWEPAEEAALKKRAAAKPSARLTGQADELIITPAPARPFDPLTHPAAPAPAVDPIDAFRDRMRGERAERRAAGQPERLPSPSAPVYAPPASVQAVAAPKPLVERLVAVSAAGETTGAVVYWSLAGELDLGKMTAAWTEAALPEAWLPSAPSEVAAFHRAAKDEQRSRTLVRHHHEGGWQFVFELAVEGQPLAYDVGPRLVITHTQMPDGSKVDYTIEVADDEHKDHPAAPALLERVRAAYRRHLRTVASVDVSSWLIWLCKQVKAVSLRQTGGVYFIPRDAVDTWHAAKNAVKQSSAHRIFEIPALNSEDAVAAIFDAVGIEVTDLLEQVQGELQEGLGARKAKTRLEQVATLLEKIESYERLFGQPMKGARERLAATTLELRKSATRGSMLEVD